MRGRLAVITTIVLLVALLAALNAASYVYKEDAPADSEFDPNRSSYHDGVTGTRGLYEFLQESNYRAVRWRRKFTDLLAGGANQPRTLIVVGRTRLPLDDEDGAALVKWVGGGGRLIFCDRNWPEELNVLFGDWRIDAEMFEYPPLLETGERPGEEVVAGVEPLSPAQPTALARRVNRMMFSRYAARWKLTAPAAAAVTTEVTAQIDEDVPPPPAANTDEDATPPPVVVPPDETGEEADGDAAGETDEEAGGDDEERDTFAPVAHFADERGALLVDQPYGAGRVILLSDPFVVSNGGVGRADNLQLALNMIGDPTQLVAFDEFHHGHGAARETLLTYFAGTPIPLLAAQTLMLTLAYLWARSRRFARPLPAPRVDRRSKLEYITSMAELQMRARAFDLALENIYTRTRRVLARTSGTDITASRERLAARVAQQSGRVDQKELETLLCDCEDAIAGAPTGGQRALQLATALRRLERALGVRERRRETKQAHEKN